MSTDVSSHVQKIDKENMVSALDVKCVPEVPRPAFNSSSLIFTCPHLQNVFNV